MKRGSLFCLVGFLFCLVGFLFCLSARCPVPSVGAASILQPSGILDPGAERLGALTLATLSGAERVESFRVGVAPGFGQALPVEKIDNHVVSAHGSVQGKGFAAQVAAILRDPRLSDDPRDRCLFQPGIVFRFWKGRASVDCLLCFHCDDVLIVTRDAGGRVIRSEFTHFAPLRPALLGLIKQAFPADQEIQRLPAK